MTAFTGTFDENKSATQELGASTAPTDLLNKSTLEEGEYFEVFSTFSGEIQAQSIYQIDSNNTYTESSPSS
jgi:hypothetical protein